MKQPITLLLMLSFFSLFSQTSEKEINQLYKDYQYYNSREFAYLKPDKKIYYSGESLDFDVAVFNQYFSLSKLSRIIHVDLLSEDEDVTRNYIFRLESGKAKGKISLPQDIPSGNYQMVAYTHFMRNHDIDFSAHRVPIYVQNVLDESTSQVVKAIGYPDDLSTKAFENTNVVDVSVKPNAISLEIQTPTNEDFFVVSEGFKSVQLIAKINPKGPVTQFALPRGQFKGGFQRFILLNSDLEIVAIRPFYLNSSKPILRKKNVENKVSIDVVDNLITKIHLEDQSNPINDELTSLFKRLYRIYFNIPLGQSLEELTFNELTADSTMIGFSKYSYARWNEVVDGLRSDSNIQHFPEKNIQLSGRVEGDSTIVAESNIAIHLFENQLDITKKLDLDGRFFVELILPSGQDYFKATVLNDAAVDISEQVNILFNEYESFRYNSNLSFHEKSLTDSIIKSNLEFKYILSTYSTEKAKKQFFWDDIKFDKKTLISDYYSGIKDFEEFIREAVANVSVAERKGEKILKIYNYSEGNFGKPQLVILDNYVLNSTVPLFKIPLDSIESINTIFNEETLKAIGKNFLKGIIVVNTKSGAYPVANSELDPSFREFTGYTIGLSNNEVSDQFNSTVVSDLSFSIREDYEFNEKTMQKNGRLSIESFSKEGFYFNTSAPIKK
ncbi:hypothetical protein [Ekhidna sp.]